MLRRQVSRLTREKVALASVLTLENEEIFWPEFRHIVRHNASLCIQTRAPRYHIQYLPEIFYLSLTRNLRPGLSQLKPLARSSGAKVLIATDGGQRTHLKTLCKLCPNIAALVIGHGSVRADSLRQVGILPQLNGGRLLLWGESDIGYYKRVFGKVPHNLAVGSLRNAFYWRNFRVGQPTPIKKFPVSFVSQFADLKEDDETRPHRTRVLKHLKSHLARFCREQKLPLRILLRPEVSGRIAEGSRVREIQHYQEVFSGIDLSFSNPLRRYVSYLESDQSEVTVGVPTGTLIESFARGNKVLMIAQDAATGDYFGSPVSGPFSLEEPTYSEFELRLLELLNQSQREFADSFRSEREFVVANACSDHAIGAVELELKRLLDTR